MSLFLLFAIVIFAIVLFLNGMTMYFWMHLYITNALPVGRPAFLLANLVIGFMLDVLTAEFFMSAGLIEFPNLHEMWRTLLIVGVVAALVSQVVGAMIRYVREPDPDPTP